MAVKTFLNNIELILTLAGLVIVAILAGVLGNDEIGFWKVAAVTALATGILHGLLFWVVRSRQRRIRAHIIGEIRLMLQDQINNKLAIIAMTSEFPGESDSAREEALAMSKGAVANINESLSRLSEESLRMWKSRFPKPKS